MSKPKISINIASLIVLILVVVLGFFTFQPKTFTPPANDYRASDPNDSLYKELSDTQIIKDELKIGAPEDKMAILSKHQNNVVELNIYNPNGAGYGLWVKKVNGTWTKLYTGQQQPDCPLLKKAGVEAGVTCLNPNSATECTGDKANSDCFYPKTK